MASFLSLVIVGNLTADPELKYTRDGTPVCSFRVAVNSHKKNPDHNAVFIRCSAWRNLAETVAQYAHKGDSVLVQCDWISNGAFIRDDGSAGASLDATAQSVQFLTRRDASQPDAQDTQPDALGSMEEIPF